MRRGDIGSRLVELPIGATEDRVVGSLDLQQVLRDGEHAFSPGLLARAHGGVLYVDEVNLLHDHLVDVLLDAAAMGRVHVERDGISHSHEARFVLIGTMNPEEGELRPQLLDRFGLTVDVRASRDVDVRVEVIRRRMAFEADPDGVRGAVRRTRTPNWPRRIAAARAVVGDVVLPDNELRRIAALCAAFDVDGMRADLVVARTAVAHAAWRGRDEHGRARRTSGSPPNSRCRTGVGATRSTTPAWIPTSSTRRWRQAGESADQPGTRARPGSAGRWRRVRRRSGSAGAATELGRVGARAPAPPPSAAFRTRALVVPGVGEGAPGRRSRARNRTGTVVSAATADPNGVTACTCSRRCSRPRADSGGRAGCVRRPTTCAARCARAARATW